MINVPSFKSPIGSVLTLLAHKNYYNEYSRIFIEKVTKFVLASLSATSFHGCIYQDMIHLSADHFRIQFKNIQSFAKRCNKLLIANCRKMLAAPFSLLNPVCTVPYHFTQIACNPTIIGTAL